jgi:hypothetical protein
MTQFEFISVAVSIVLAISAARLLSALPHAMAQGKRYWIHALWCVILLAPHLGFWWAIWTYRSVDTWTFRGFASLMLTPAFLFLSVSALVSDSPATIGCWREHFYRQHRIFFSLFLAALVSIPFRQFVVLGDAFAPISEGAPESTVPLLFGFLLIPMIGIVATSERVHAILVVITTGIVLLNFGQL